MKTSQKEIMSTFVDFHEKSYKILAVDRRGVGSLGTVLKKQTKKT
jgi:hypothetical protein